MSLFWRVVSQDQSRIEAFTVDQFRDYNIEGAVGYTVQGQDNVEDFNLKLNQQRLLQQTAKSFFGFYFSDTDVTTAPNNNWDEYFDLTAVKSMLDIANINYDDSLSVLDRIFPGSKPFYGLRPYVPGYSSSTNGSDVDASQSAGVDCSGFVQRAITDAYKASSSHSWNSYEVESLGSSWWSWVTTSWCHHTLELDGIPYHVKGENHPNLGYAFTYKESRRYFFVYGDSNNMTNKPYNLKLIASRSETNNTNLTRVIPGDIFYYWIGNGYHVGIVNHIKYDDIEGRRSVNENDIYLIQSTISASPTVFNVTKDKGLYLYHYDREAFQWNIGRLLTK